MKTKLLCLAAFLSPLIPISAQPALQAPPTATPYNVVEQGAHHKVWQRVAPLTNSAGKVTFRTHRYTEIATGMSRFAGGQWVDANDQIQITATGAQATNAQHSVVFAGNINTPGAIRLVTPDGLHLANNVLGLSYWDSASGKSVFIAEIRDSLGQLLPAGNEATYPDAFDGGFRADLLYVNSISSFEQLVVFRELPPAPDQFGLDPATTYLQVITEFQSPPAPQVVQASGQGDADQCLNFGLMQMGRGEAFAIGSETNRIPVAKRWLLLDGRQCLVEQIPFPAARAQLQQLPAPPPPTASLHPASGSLVGRVTTRRLLPEARLARRSESGFTLAGTALPLRGFAMDYKSVTVQTNRVFQSDTTYLVTNNVTLMGTNVFEGGTVIKFATNAVLTIAPSLTPLSFSFRGDDYRPIVFTAKDDNSAGEPINGSTGVPTNYYANPALVIAGVSAPALGHLRFAYAKQAISVSGLNADIFDAQFVNCQSGVAGVGATVTLRNALFANTVTNLVIQNTCTFSAENVTFSGSAYLATGPSVPGSSLALTNCILANITNLTTGTLATSGDYNGFYQTSPFGYDLAPTNYSSPFQAVGAANYYLADGCVYRNAGTFTVNPSLLVDLAKKTTYPPVVYAQTTIYSDTTLFPQAQRDTDAPDLGYHYEPIDFAMGRVYVTNATVTVSPGTAVGIFDTNSGTYGFNVVKSAALATQGTPRSPSRIFAYNTVQEQSLSGWTEPSYGMIIDTYNLPAARTFNFSFTDFSSLAQDVYFTYISTAVANLRDCQLHGGILVACPSTMNLTNCLLERVATDLEAADNNLQVIRNNTFFGGGFGFYPNVTNAVIMDNLFDQTTFYYSPSPAYNGGFNAYVTNVSRLNPGSATDILLSSPPSYQSGPLGNYYLLSSSQLFDADTNTTAAQVGLYHYTTITNIVSGYQLKETNSPLDCGFHYVAVDSNTNAIDSNADGIPDYVSDANGNGQVDSGEIGWNINGDLGLKVLITRPKNNANIP